MIALIQALKTLFPIQNKYEKVTYIKGDIGLFTVNLLMYPFRFFPSLFANLNLYNLLFANLPRMIFCGKRIF